MEMLTGSAFEAKQSMLMDLAHRCAEQLRARPGTVGLVLCGSLSMPAPLELTRFSDVDIALVMDRELPAYFSEHRLAEGVKLDVLLFHLDTVRELAAKEPERLYQGGWVQHYLIKSFLLGSPETILFDPSGEMARVKQTLNERTAYEAMVVPDARRWLEYTDKECLTPLEGLREKGDFREVVRKCGHAAGMLGGMLRERAVTKRLEVAAERLGIPGFASIAAELGRMAAPGAAAAEEYWHAAQALWDHTRANLFAPLREELGHRGVEDPDKLELIGDYRLFWGGHRIHEFGRVIAEVDLSLEWSRSELDAGNVNEALDLLWGCEAGASTRRCEGLAAALKDIGWDVSDRVSSFLEAAEFRRLLAEVERTGAAVQTRDASEAEAERAIGLAREMRRMVADVLAVRAGAAAPVQSDASAR